VRARYSDIEDAYHYVSWGEMLDATAAVNKRTGEILTHSDDLVDEEWISDEDWETGDWVTMPVKLDLGLGQDVVFDFVSARMPEEYDRVSRFFSHRGAYGRFKNLLSSKNLLDAWYAFEAEAQEKALRQWCQDEGIELED
jgi:hypothetical protein